MIRPFFVALMAAWILFLSSMTMTRLMASEPIVDEPATEPAEYGRAIRTTLHRSPAEELAGFHLPAEYTIELIAAEPDIQKPLNLAFDSKGRLWLTQTHLYPFPAKEGEFPTDSIVVMEDQDGDGTRERKAIFADGLNIPMGLLPWKDGVICFSIPHLWYLSDADGDGSCDERKILYGPFDTTRDTHGLVNSLRDGGDGWIYACHGFNNRSKVAGSDGHLVEMDSGNIFRFRPDGTRIELYSQGQVNPFGMTRDRWGVWYAADCHSKPISQLIFGGCHPSFGRPDDGLGFVPSMMNHLHGSTAIAGLAHTDHSTFSPDLQEQFLSGNVMTSRINRNRLSYQGATATAIELPDFLTSDDPWFRPVDLVFDPQGDLYIADFYNKIIGHYEVPLHHPDRDRTSGRVWRVRWQGRSTTQRRPCEVQIGFEDDHAAAPPANDRDHSASSSRRALLEQVDLRTTAAAIGWWKEAERTSLDPTADDLHWLLKQSHRVATANDRILSQVLLIALRRTILRLGEKDPQLSVERIRSFLDAETSPRSSAAHALLRVLPAIKGSRYVELALSWMRARLSSLEEISNSDREIFHAAINRISEGIDDENIDRLIELLSEENAARFFGGESSVVDRLIALARMQQQSRGVTSSRLNQWLLATLDRLSRQWLDEHGSQNELMVRGWIATSHPSDGAQSWPREDRRLHGKGSKRAEPLTETLSIYSSFPLGENYTGEWATFVPSAPSVWAFSMAGHNGPPKDADHQKNYAALITFDSATGATRELFRAYPPRSDIPIEITWPLGEHSGKPIVFKVVDGDNGKSYAWIGVGGFGHVGLQPSKAREELDRLGSLLSILASTDALQSGPWDRLLQSNAIDDLSRLQLLWDVWRKREPVPAEILRFSLESGHFDWLVRHPLPTRAGDPDELHPWFQVLSQEYPLLFRRWSASQQLRLVERISKIPSAPILLAQWIEQGHLPPDVLKTLPSAWWSTIPYDAQRRLLPFRSTAQGPADLSAQVAKRLDAISKLSGDFDAGQSIFLAKCAQCHRLGEMGKVVGPQLEGVGNRGLERLGEDILWPDRNVDEAFRLTILLLSSGETISGLIQYRTGDSISLAEPSGVVRVIPFAELEHEKRSEASLMPSNFGETLTDQELASLLEFLRRHGRR